MITATTTSITKHWKYFKLMQWRGKNELFAGCCVFDVLQLHFFSINKKRAQRETELKVCGIIYQIDFVIGTWINNGDNYNNKLCMNCCQLIYICKACIHNAFVMHLLFQIFLTTSPYFTRIILTFMYWFNSPYNEIFPLLYLFCQQFQLQQDLFNVFFMFYLLKWKCHNNWHFEVNFNKKNIHLLFNLTEEEERKGTNERIIKKKPWT